MSRDSANYASEGLLYCGGGTVAVVTEGLFRQAVHGRYYLYLLSKVGGFDPY